MVVVVAICFFGPCRSLFFEPSSEPWFWVSITLGLSNWTMEMDYRRDPYLVSRFSNCDGCVPRQYVIWREIISPCHAGVNSMKGPDCWTWNSCSFFRYTIGIYGRRREISVEFLWRKANEITTNLLGFHRTFDIRQNFLRNRIKEIFSNSLGQFIKPLVYIKLFGQVT